jgi:NAD(P)-dependent dehydrogenase (short-subunit alcohol dehydrogenase family)
MKTALTLITGASRGLGRAVAEQLLAQGHQVVGLSRQAPAGLSSPRFVHLAADLADARAPAAQLEAWLAAQGPQPWSSATLINNAGVVSRLAPLAEIEADDLANAIRVGLEAPLLLSAAFLRATRGWPLPRKLLLVSSGLGRRPMAGSVSYCAAKAGLDHLARALALEEAARPDGARVVSLAPGVIDTDMQQQLRGADPQAFPERARFAELHAGGQLDSPAAAAVKLLRYLDRADFGSNPVADVRDA